MRRAVLRLVIGLWLGFPALSSAQAVTSPPPPPLFDEPALFAKAMARVEKAADGGNREGLYPEFGGMITGAGWISIGPGYRRHLFGGRAQLDGSAAISWRAYKFAQARLEFPALAQDRLTIGSQLLWYDYTQVRYYGLGPSTLETDVSDFRIQATTVVGYASWRLRPSLAVSASVGAMTRPALSASVGTFDRGHPDTLQVHASEPAAALPQQPRFVYAALGVTVDTRDQPGYPTRGHALRAAWSTFHDRPGASLAFDRFEAEAAYFRPLLGRSLLAGRAWGVFSHTRDGHVVPFYFMPGLGGHNTLRGYADYRFHDRHMIVVNLETRWPLFRHVDLTGFFDAGNVAARVGDLNLDRTSVGVGLRLHTPKEALARLDLAHSAEGWRLMFKLSDPLRVGRGSKRTAPLPFVP
jgi:hypothetical protein